MSKTTDVSDQPKKATKKDILKSVSDGTATERKFMDEPENGKPHGNSLAGFKPIIEILKGKLLKGDIVQIEYLKTDSPDSKPAEVSEKHTDPPRQKFKDAFDALCIHAALIGEFIPLTAISDIANIDAEVTTDYNVSGFTVVASGDHDEGVIITAQKTLKNGKSLGFNTPTTRYNDESENCYPYLDELAVSVDLCKQEVREYLNGNYAVDPQLKLDLE